MKWFKKLFQKKSVKISESKHSKIDSISHFQEPQPQEVFALTTIHNFRTDQLKDFAVDSEWVILSQEEILNPRFQEKLVRPENLKEHCKALAERSRHKIKVQIVSRSPTCHCDELDLENSMTVKPKMCPLKRVFTAVAKFWCRICKRLKICICRKKKTRTEMSGTSENASTSACWYFIFSFYQLPIMNLRSALS